MSAAYTILREVHIRSEDIRTGTVHLLAEEILLQRTLANLVVLQSDVPVGTERARQDSNISEQRFEGFIQDIRHFVFKVLSSDYPETLEMTYYHYCGQLTERIE